MKTNVFKKVVTLAFVLFVVGSAYAQIEGKLVNVQRITSDGSRYCQLQWSPDGTKLAFAKEGFADGLEMIEMGTNVRTKITDMTDAGLFYSWSADSKEILFRDTKWNGKERTHTHYVVDLKGKKQQVSESQRYLQAASWKYENDGTKRVFTKDGKILAQPVLPKMSVSLTKSTLNKRANLTTYNDVDRMQFFLIDENGKQILLNDKGLGYVPQFSPNGEKLIYNEDSYLILVDSDGKNRRDLGRGFRANWLNNNQIVFELTEDDGHMYTKGNLWIMNIDGSNRMQITNATDRIDMYPVYNAQTKKLAFVSHVDGQIYVADLK